MVACGACGRFMNKTDGASCSKCALVYHLACLGKAKAAAKLPNWLCPECSKNHPRDNRQETPVRANLEQEAGHGQGIAGSPSGEIRADLALEIRSFRQELSEMRAEIRECRKEIAEFQSGQSHYNERISCVEDRLSVLESKIDESVAANDNPVEKVISELRRELNERDQLLLSNDVVFAGVPEQSDENIIHTILIIAAKLGVELDDKDVVHIERIGSTHRNRDLKNNSTAADSLTQRPRIIAVRFTRRAARDRLLRAARVRRGLTTTDIDMRGTPQQIYVNERLTRTNQQLLQRARGLGRQKQWKYVWSKDGKIFARKDEGKPGERIATDLDINRIFG